MEHDLPKIIPPSIYSKTIPSLTPSSFNNPCDLRHTTSPHPLENTSRPPFSYHRPPFHHSTSKTTPPLLSLVLSISMAAPSLQQVTNHPSHQLKLSPHPKIIIGYYIRNLNRLQYPSFLAKVNIVQYPSILARVKNASLTANNWKEEQAIVSFPDSKAFQEEATEYGGNTKEEGDLDNMDNLKMIRVCDKLIEVFLLDKPSPTDWRRLLIFSKEWSSIRPHFFMRCEERAESEDNPEMKHKLLRLGRKLREIDEDVQRANELLEVVRGSSESISEVVARRRKDFTKEFFEHLHTVAESYYDNPEEQNAVVELGNRCLSAVQAYDTASESLEAINSAEVKFQDIINSPTLDAACRKIDTLAAKNELDSALVLMITKAWSSAKESNMMKDEVKDVLYHLYKTARGNLQRLMPKEIRIVKYLLTIEDPEEKLSALQDAFTPGEELEGTDVDNLYTTPEKLHTWIKAVVDAYHLSQEGTLIREARDLMNPKIIQKLEELNKIVQDRFL